MKQPKAWCYKKHINTVALCFFIKMNLVILSLCHKQCPAAVHAHRLLWLLLIETFNAQYVVSDAQ